MNSFIRDWQSGVIELISCPYVEIFHVLDVNITLATREVMNSAYKEYFSAIFTE